MQNKPDVMHFLDECRGIYIPRDFAQCIDRSKVSGIELSDLDFLVERMDADHYWDVWDEIMRDCVITDDNGQRWTLYQDGGLFLIPEGMEWSDEIEWFAYPTEDDNAE